MKTGNKLPKSVLVRHLTEPHGTRRVVLDASELKTWTVHELQIEHVRLMEAGPCSLVAS